MTKAEITKEIHRLLNELGVDPGRSGFILITGDMDTDEINSKMFGDLKVIGNIVGSGLTGIDNFRNIILAATCDYLRNNEQDKKLFIDALRLPGMEILAN